MEQNPSDLTMQDPSTLVLDSGRVETAGDGSGIVLGQALERLREIASESARRRDALLARPITISPEWRARYLGLTEYCPEVRKACEAAEMFAKKWVRDIRYREDGTPRTWLVMIGENGVGKTHLAKRLFSYAGKARVTAWDMGYWDHPPGRVWVDWPDLVASESDGVWQDALEADLLIVDEIGGEKDRWKNGEPLRRLTSLLGKRENRWTVITTNARQNDWAQTWDKRVADRLRRCSKAVDLSKVKPWSVVDSKEKGKT